MSDEGQIHSVRDGAVFEIGIDRPAKRNGFTPHMMRALAEAYTAFEADDEARVGLLWAAGEHFTGGLDLPKMAPLMKRGERLVPETLVDPFGLREPRLTKPMVVAVQGWCLTLGIEVMLAADIVIAEESARFTQLEVQRGLMASGGATIRMAERAGWGNAMRWLLTGDVFEADEALRIGFVQEMVPTGTARARAREVADRIAAQAPLAVRASLLNARIASEQGPAAAIAEFHEVQTRLAASDDLEEGVRAFVERRPGNFTGR
jgi:enoyl-CoA hydratase/carnithine racemase